MKVERLEQIDELLREGWELTIRGVPAIHRTERSQNLQASIVRPGVPKLHETSSHHFIGATAIDALAGLDNYLHAHRT